MGHGICGPPARSFPKWEGIFTTEARRTEGSEPRINTDGDWEFVRFGRYAPLRKFLRLRSGFRLSAVAPLTPTKRLNFGREEWGRGSAYPVLKPWLSSAIPRCRTGCLVWERLMAQRRKAPHLPKAGKYGPREMWATSPPGTKTLQACVFQHPQFAFFEQFSPDRIGAAEPFFFAG